MKVAFSKINITPKDYIGKPMAGYSRKDPCLGKLDNIHAYGVLLNINEKDNDNILLLSVDILKLPLSIVEYIKARLISRFEFLKLDKIIIQATHTHASFDLTGEFYYPGGTFAFMKGVMFADNKNDKYIVWMTNRIIYMVDKLFRDLVSCKVAWKKEKFNPDMVLNRRWPLKITTPDLGILSFKSIDNQLIGIIVNYACHPTTLSYKNNKLSADFPGRVIYKIEELSDNKVKALYINGPSGDLNPITTSGTDFKKIDEDKTITYDQLGTYEHSQKIGYSIGEEALKLAKSLRIEEYTELTSIKVFSNQILIPQKDAKYFSKVWLSNTLKWAIKKYFLFKIAKFDKKSVNFPFFTIERKKFKSYCKTVIQFLKLKNENDEVLGFLTIPGELFEEIGKKLLMQSPIKNKNTFLFQNSQDWIGYLFSLKMYIEEGGYEPFMCFSPLGGEYIRSKVLNLFKKIKENSFN